jgi:pyruvate,water dikinase
MKMTGIDTRVPNTARVEQITLAKFVRTFAQLGKEMYEECGGKAAHLGELTKLDLSVPNGFSVLGKSYYHHLEVNHLQEQINALAETLNPENYKDMEATSQTIRDLIMGAPIPPEIEAEIRSGYANLAQGKDVFVAVRSSVAIQGSAISSFPGMMDTFHYIRGGNDVVAKVKECWASVWSGRAAHTRISKHLEHNKAVIAPTVQLMVNSEVAGVLFTLNPINRSRDEIVIESNWGLGETVVSGRCSSDFYVLRKLCSGYGVKTCPECPYESTAVREEKIANKVECCIGAEGGGRQWVKNPPEKAQQPTLTALQLHELCRVSCMIEEHYRYPQDIEWAFEKGRLYILQTRRAKVGGA